MCDRVCESDSRLVQLFVVDVYPRVFEVLKSTINFVFFTIMQSLLALLQASRWSTFSLYSASSLQETRAITAMLSANLTVWLLGNVAKQS